GDLALTNMGLGDKAPAFALAEHALAANPIEKDALDGPQPIEILARVAARMGEPDRAIAALQKLLSIPYGGPLAQNVPLTPALLRLDPMFDPLRNDPRFEKLVASAAPKTAGRFDFGSLVLISILFVEHEREIMPESHLARLCGWRTYSSSVGLTRER